MATAGPAGVQVSAFPCEAVGFDLYLLVPRTSDHVFNLEQDCRVAMRTNHWELTGKGQALPEKKDWPRINLIRQIEPAWYVLIKVVPDRVHILRSEGWGATETIDLA